MYNILWVYNILSVYNILRVHNIVGSFDEGGKLLCLMVQHVSKTIDICHEVKYTDDDKLEKLRIVLNELKTDYLVQHLRRYSVYASTTTTTTSNTTIL